MNSDVAVLVDVRHLAKAPERMASERRADPPVVWLELFDHRNDSRRQPVRLAFERSPTPIIVFFDYRKLEFSFWCTGLKGCDTPQSVIERGTQAIEDIARYHENPGVGLLNFDRQPVRSRVRILVQRRGVWPRVVVQIRAQSFMQFREMLLGPLDLPVRVDQSAGDHA